MDRSNGLSHLTLSGAERAGQELLTDAGQTNPPTRDVKGLAGWTNYRRHLFEVYLNRTNVLWPMVWSKAVRSFALGLTLLEIVCHYIVSRSECNGQRGLSVILPIARP